ncbi:MAG: YicC/YloC family endoribonuclease [Bacteroidota bacterium]
MTGYGRAQYEDENLLVNVEVRTLNAKYFEVNIRLPKELYDQEITLKHLVQKELERGKVSITVEYEQKNNLALSIDEETFASAYKQLADLAEMLRADKKDLMRLVVQYSGALNGTQMQTLAPETWQNIKKTFLEAVVHTNAFRMREGAALKVLFSQYIQTIREKLTLVEAQDPKRTAHVRQRIQTKLTEIRNDEMFDENRFEQEVIYYIEKLDISEEKARLLNHLDYFEEMLDTDKSNGKKLGFIAQEMGREINTIGSKANDFLIQRYVVEMKDELEKIKEQLLNIL